MPPAASIILAVPEGSSTFSSPLNFDGTPARKFPSLQNNQASFSNGIYFHITARYGNYRILTILYQPANIFDY